MSLIQKIAHNTIIQFSGKLAGTFIGVLTIAIMARYLGTFGFGQYSTITAYLQFFGIMVDMGLSLVIIRLINEPGLNSQKAINNIFTLRFFSALIFLGLAPLIVIFFPYDNVIKIGVAITTISFFASALNQVLISLFQKEFKMGWVSLAEITGRLVLLISVWIFAYLNWGLLAIMLAVVLGSIVNFLIVYFSALKFIKVEFEFNWLIWKKIITYTWPLALSIAFNLVYFKADTIILSLFRSQEEVGLYNAPYRVLEILVNFVFLFMGLIFPVLTAYWTQKNYAKFKDLFQKTFDALIIMSVPMIFGTMFIAKKLMLLIAGAEFAESALILKIIIFATAIIFINALFGYAVVIIDKQKQMVPVYILVAIISLTGYLLTIPKYGYYGAAIFTIISEALIFIFNLVLVIRTTKIKPSLLIILKAGASAVVMSFVLYFLQAHSIVWQLFLGGLTYLAALYLFKGFSRNFIMEIINLKSRPEIEKIDGSP